MALLLLEFAYSQPSNNPNIEYETSPLSIVIDGAVTFYQKKISSKSVSRCPFHISCSNFLINSINENGTVVGLALFIDRYFYRENASISKHYPIIITNRIQYNDTISKEYINYLYNN